MIDDHYPMAEDKTTSNFDLAIPKFYGKLLNCPKARDVHYWYLEYKATKDPFMGCNSHLRCWKKYFRISKNFQNEFSKIRLKTRSSYDTFVPIAGPISSAI